MSKKYSSIQTTSELKEMLDKEPGKSYEEKIWNLKNKKDKEVEIMVEKVVKKVLDEKAERRKYWKAEKALITWGRRAFLEGE